MKKLITGTITHTLPEAIGKGNKKYFIIKVKGDDGIKYDILPSEDTEEYETWKELVKDGIGKMFEGFQYSGEGKYGPYLNKHVLPYKLDNKAITNTLL